MAAETVLIAGFTGRALAQAARRAGYVPLVVDAFGDSDTRAAAHDYRQIENAVRVGFSAKPLVTALDALVAAAPAPPIGIIVGSGFEDRPRLLASLGQRYGLIGCSAERVQHVKDPGLLTATLKHIGIDHPETRTTAPAPGDDGWLVKRIGASGGRHVQVYRGSGRDGAEAKPATTYYQRRIDGQPMSIFAVAAPRGVAIEVSRQWPRPSARAPYRYGGAVLADYQDNRTDRQMVDAACALIETLGLVGLVSFDFVVTDDTAYLLEINPRPGATLDVFDDADGNLFHAHIAACRTGTLWETRNLPPFAARAAQILYADRGDVTVPDIDWPAWTADRPLAKSRIRAGHPIATVFGEGADSDTAFKQSEDRLQSLADLIYSSDIRDLKESIHARA
ncbi:MAG: ATP-grasp domain-containing protein [Hyphomicrobium sp.]